MNLTGTQAIQTQRLLLRRYAMDDVDAMYENWASDDEVTRYLTRPTHKNREVTRAVVADWVESYNDPGVFHWGIEMDGRLIGDIAVVNASTKNSWAEIGYCLSRAAWGQGIMSEALNAVLRFLFEQIGVHRVTLRHDTHNPASGRVMIKNGLVHEGTMREVALRLDGTWADLAIYGILRGEWLARNE